MEQRIQHHPRNTHITLISGQYQTKQVENHHDAIDNIHPQISTAKMIGMVITVLMLLLCLIIPPMLLSWQMDGIKIKQSELKQNFSSFKDFAMPILVEYQVELTKAQGRYRLFD